MPGACRASSSSPAIAAASASGVAGRDEAVCAVVSHHLGQGARRLATSGVAVAMASTAGSEKPSYSEGTHAISGAGEQVGELGRR